jgi:hypothetical protein
MGKQIKNGTKKTIRGKPCVYYDGYWVRRYEVESNDLATKKRLIDQLTRRVFHHLEPGINTPGNRLEEIREIYEKENDPARKRVKGAMLAGALLNRGADILTTIVDLEEAGVTIEPGNELLKKCGRCFMEALELGKHIKLASGGEGLDELWGEPFKAFSQSMEDFYRSRYIKVSQTMREIDQITEKLVNIIRQTPVLRGAKAIILELGENAKLACETLRSDPVIFEIWPRYVAAKEALETNLREAVENSGGTYADRLRIILELIREGGSLLVSLSTVRVPMPKSVSQFMDKCKEYSL